MSWNPVNNWIRAGGDHESKKKRRFIVAGACVAGAVVCALAGGWFFIGTIVLGGVAAVKIKNALTDES